MSEPIPAKESLAEQATQDHDFSEWTAHDLAELFVQVDAEATLLAAFRRDIRDALVLILDDQIIVGTTSVAPTRRPVFHMPTVKAALLPKVTRHLVDPETGDRVEAVPLDDVRELFAPNRATQKMKRLGLRFEYEDAVEVKRL